jgi:hypothetical protein
MSLAVYQSSRCHIPDDLNILQPCCKNLASVKSALGAQILLTVRYDSTLHTDCCESDHTPVQPQIILLWITLSISRIKNRFQ